MLTGSGYVFTKCCKSLVLQTAIDRITQLEKENAKLKSELRKNSYNQSDTVLAKHFSIDSGFGLEHGSTASRSSSESNFASTQFQASSCGSTSQFNSSPFLVVKPFDSPDQFESALLNDFQAIPNGLDCSDILQDLDNLESDGNLTSSLYSETSNHPPHSQKKSISLCMVALCLVAIWPGYLLQFPGRLVNPTTNTAYSLSTDLFAYGLQWLTAIILVIWACGSKSLWPQMKDSLTVSSDIVASNKVRCDCSGLDSFDNPLRATALSQFVTQLQ
ncbi:hypothetical protein Ciccas_007815 [Cichlidogyrus casuarinus]|uniref:Uncharacterized protein n=1 Tax=Cichlidogyrus casuarinus TaxID=1844966 RepID=A0ABD2Q1S6_9PLAT